MANEYLKASDDNLLRSVLVLFNECLDKGIYPWNTTIITPLHKKGDIYNPDNYRAIAVGSFDFKWGRGANWQQPRYTIILQRLIEFRDSHCPDTNNQLGFCRSAQTADHLFSLHTCIEKDVKHGKKRLYACFVDLKKAFNTVCRDQENNKISGKQRKFKFYHLNRHKINNNSSN